MAAPGLSATRRHDRLAILASLAVLFLLSWLFLLHLAARMDSMEGIAARMMGMPGQDALSVLLTAAMSPAAAAVADAAVNFILVALMWLAMMIGMMLPGAAPTILLFSALERKRSQGPISRRSAAFVAGYFVIWGVFSGAAAALQTLLSHAGLVSMQMAATTALLSGSIFIAAGLYEFTPLKARCLIHCRSPLEWIPRHMRPGLIGAFRMGMEHGAYCVGCCWVLMLLLFAGGVMNLLWVAAIAVVVLAQKLVPGGPLVSRVAGVAFVGWGALLILTQSWNT
jgi:predicted metal-binding membrane protein